MKADTLGEETTRFSPAAIAKRARRNHLKVMTNSNDVRPRAVKSHNDAVARWENEGGPPTEADEDNAVTSVGARSKVLDRLAN